MRHSWRRGTELSPALYEAWGRALGRQLPPSAKFVVGGDVRESTPAFLAALVEGLCQAGLDVVDLGLLPTPMIYYAKRRLHADGCAIVTASHNPAAINGLKWMLRRPPARRAEDVCRGFAEQCRGHRSGDSGTRAQAHAEGQGDGDGTAAATASRTLDISFDYVACLQETFVDSLTAQQHVVVDPMYGCWAAKARRYLHAIFPQCLSRPFTTRSTPASTAAMPDCSRQERIGRNSCDAVYRQRAHLGVAFDGDGDRVALVDNEGVALRAEEAAWVLLQCLGNEMQGEPFVHDVKFSDRIPEAARQLGAEPLVERSGHAFIRTRMRNTAACSAPRRAGTISTGRWRAATTACTRPASDRPSRPLGRDVGRVAPRLPAGLHHARSARDGRPRTIQPKMIEQIRAAWEGFPQRTIDGVRIDTPGGWALVRSSVTEPALTFRFEGLDWHALDDLVERFCDAMPEYGDELRGHFRAAIGGEEP